MSLRIDPKSLSVSFANPTQRLGGQTQADVHVLAHVANKEPDVLTLEASSVTLSLTGTAGQLLLVEIATEINGKDELEVRGNSDKALKIKFIILPHLLGMLSDADLLGLDIGHDSVQAINMKSVAKVIPSADLLA